MASTYTTLGFEDQATGENSGTWGTKADVIFLQIEELLGVNTYEWASDANQTLNLSDGATGEDARAQALILTAGTITAARDLTLGPNDVEKTYIIQNDTGYTITVKQGSGASVAVPTGQRSMVYMDGGGATAAVYSVFDNVALERPRMQSYTEAVNAIGTTSSATCDMSAYSMFTLTASGSTTINLTNAPTSGEAGFATIIVTNDATPQSSYTWQYGGSAMTILSTGGVDPAPTASNGAVDVFTFFTLDGGTNFYATESILNAT
jgi:hypothetical protein